MKSVLKKESALYVGGWKVSPETLHIHKEDESVKLEPLVMKVLLYLADRPDKVVPRQELEDHLWEDRIVGYDALSNTIIKIRKAFHDNSRNPKIIKTISKNGYQMIAEVKWNSTNEKKEGSRKFGKLKILKNRYKLSAILMVSLLLILFWVFQDRSGNNSQNIPSMEQSAKPSIAVLPFKNLNNKQDDYFSNGITQDLITDLSKISGLRVVAIGSVLAYKEEQKDESAISKELDVLHLLKGSIQKDHNTIRLNIHLLDARSGNTIWAERYDRQLTDIFKIQDELTQKVVANLEVKLAPEDKKRLIRNYLVNLEAYDAFLRGQEYFSLRTISDNKLAEEQFSKAIKLDPGFGRAYAALALSQSWDLYTRWEIDIEESLVKASNNIEKALQIDDSVPQTHFVKGRIELWNKNYELAIQHVDRALELEANYADAYTLLALIFHYSGQPQKGLEAIEQAINLNPRIPASYHMARGLLYYSLKEYDKALQDLEAAVQANPNYQRSRAWLAATYVALGRIEDAQWEIEEFLIINPGFNFSWIEQVYPFRDDLYLERLKSHLKEAGLPQ